MLKGFAYNLYLSLSGNNSTKNKETHKIQKDIVFVTNQKYKTKNHKVSLKRKKRNKILINQRRQNQLQKLMSIDEETIEGVIIFG